MSHSSLNFVILSPREDSIWDECSRSSSNYFLHIVILITYALLSESSDTDGPMLVVYLNYECSIVLTCQYLN